MTSICRITRTPPVAAFCRLLLKGKNSNRSRLPIGVRVERSNSSPQSIEPREAGANCWLILRNTREKCERTRCTGADKGSGHGHFLLAESPLEHLSPGHPSATSPPIGDRGWVIGDPTRHRQQRATLHTRAGIIASEQKQPG